MSRDDGIVVVRRHLQSLHTRGFGVTRRVVNTRLTKSQVCVEVGGGVWRFTMGCGMWVLGGVGVGVRWCRCEVVSTMGCDGVWRCDGMWGSTMGCDSGVDVGDVV